MYGPERKSSLVIELGPSFFAGESEAAMESLSSVLGAVLIAFLCGGLGQAAWGMVIGPVEDAFVVNTSADESFGSEERICTWTAYMSGGRGRSYIRFSLSGMPEESVVSGVTLNLYQYDAGGFVPIVNIHHVADDTWTQSSLTWNNQPLPAPGATDQIVTKDIGYEAEWVSFDLLSSGVWDYGADLNDGYVSLLIKSTEVGDERHNFYSSEETIEVNYRPYLEITVVPEPTALVLLGLGSLGLWRRRSA